MQTPDTQYAAAIESRVRMRGYSDAEIDEPTSTSGSGRDKAGSYGIQDAPFLPVEAIEGCYCNVMGLPLWTRRPGSALGLHLRLDVVWKSAV